MIHGIYNTSSTIYVICGLLFCLKEYIHNKILRNFELFLELPIVINIIYLLYIKSFYHIKDLFSLDCSEHKRHDRAFP
jgi:hypothetical protein